VQDTEIRKTPILEEKGIKKALKIFQGLGGDEWNVARRVLWSS